MNQIETPRTDEIHSKYCHDGALNGFVPAPFCRDIERELTAVTEQRDEARTLAEKYRYLSCDSQEEADAEVLPWENNQQPTNETK